MAEYTYKCEICEQEFTFNEPKKTPYYFPHFCRDTDTTGLQEDIILDCGGACYRVWQPTPFYIRGAK